jgi:hypothetical protein
VNPGKTPWPGFLFLQPPPLKEGVFYLVNTFNFLEQKLFMFCGLIFTNHWMRIYSSKRLSSMIYDSHPQKMSIILNNLERLTLLQILSASLA